MRNFRTSLAAAAVALAVSSGVASAQFSNLFVFGDSSADAGYFNGARFTVNPGLVFPQVLGQRYGLTIGASNAGGTDYAAGGARVTLGPGFPPLPPTDAAPPLVTQINGFLTANPSLDPRALYVVSVGYNDLFTNVLAASQGLLTPAQVQANVGLAAAQAAQQIARLQAAGARYVVVLNLYDTGKAPGGAIAPAQLSALTGLYNSTLSSGLSGAGLQLISVDSNKLFNEILASPASFGLSNVTQPACTVPTSRLCTTSTLVAPNAGQTYAFADGVHPTPASHVIIAGVVASMIEGPSQVSVLAEAPLGVEEANFRTIDARMMSGINSPRPIRKYEFWAAYDYGNNDFNGAFISGNANLNTLAAGGDVKLSEKFIVGGMFGYTENKGDFGGGNGTYKLKEASGTTYAGYGDGPWYVGATFGAGNLDFDGIRRNLQLGALNRTETANATGWHIMASVLGGYWFRTRADLQHGPFARVAYQEIRVHRFTEEGADSTALSYGEQKRESLITSLGWQATGQIGMVRPFARVTWEYENKNDDRNVSATPVGSSLTYSVPGLKPDNNFVRYVLGASADFGRVTGFITGSGTSSKSDGNGYGVTVGVRIPI